jgi:hypothetical protein
MWGFMLAALCLLSARAVAAAGAVSCDGVLSIVAKAWYRGTGAGTRQADSYDDEASTARHLLVRGRGLISAPLCERWAR